MTLEADGRHLLSDVMTSAGVLTALVIVRLTGWTYLDPITALAMAGYIGFTGIRLVRRAGAGLMDEQNPDQAGRLRAVLDAHVGPGGAPPRICSYHKLRHRHNGRYLWVDFHINMPARTTIKEAHATAGAIEGEIEQAFSQADATAHAEDCKDPGCLNCISSFGAGVAST